MLRVSFARLASRRGGCIAALLVLLGSAVASAQPPRAAPSPRETYERALQDWHDGRYASALEALRNVLRGPEGDAYFERIALLTGELYRTVEIAQNGRVPKWSPGNDYLAFEVGAGAARVTRIVSHPGLKPVAEVQGWGLAFSPDGRRVTYLSPRDSTERSAAIVVRDLGIGTERTLDDGGLVKASLAFSHDGAQVYTVAARPGETRADIFVIPADGSGRPLALPPTDSAKTDLVVIPGLPELLYTNGGRSGIPAAAGAGGPAGSGRGGRGGRSSSFTQLAVTTGLKLDLRGDSYTVSADGSTLAYFAREAGRSSLMVAPLKGPGEPRAVLTTTDSVIVPALAPDGSRIAFQRMREYDWDIFVVNRDGTGEARVTRENAHDILPQFLGPDRLLATVGEPRHRRSFLYDLKTLERTRLFHNNTVRTVAPEYEWAASPDATKVAIVAERDGDTITPHRHLYLTDLAQRITKADLLARLDENLASERALAAAGRRAFAPIAEEVKKVVAEVSTARIYGYEKALFDFDSKHITRPGNARARQFLLDTYRSFGYGESARFQPFEAGGRGGGGGGGAGGGGGRGAAASIPTANVLATLPGTENPELVYVISSHFDSRAEGPGADDNTSGTAALLEAARVLARHPMPATIVFASMTGEESGLLGSREFVRQAKDSLKIVGALNNDMIGWANDDRLDNTIRYSNAGIRDIQHAAAMLFTNLITYDAFYYKSTDAAAFYDQYGDIVGGIGSHPILSNPHYHMPHDNLEYENHQLIAEVSKTTVATIMLLASSPSRITGLAARLESGAAELTWTKSPEKGVVRYRVRHRAADGAPWKELAPVTAPRARIAGLAAGATVEVKAVNRRGLEGWDWARVVVRSAEP